MLALKGIGLIEMNLCEFHYMRELPGLILLACGNLERAELCHLHGCISMTVVYSIMSSAVMVFINRTGRLNTLMDGFLFAHVQKRIIGRLRLCLSSCLFIKKLNWFEPDLKR